ncbi:MAG: oligosaccharide flippase family protein [Nanoarchaeota archaeon]
MAFKIPTGRFARDTLALFVMLNIFNFINFLYHFIIARLLVPSDYGILITLFSIIYIFGVPSEGIQVLFARLTAKFSVNKEDGKISYIVKKGINKGFLISFFIFAVLFAASFFLSEFLKIDFWLIVLTNAMVFIFILAPVPRGVLQGKKRFGRFGLSFIAESIIRLFLSVVLVILGFKVYGAIVGVFIGVVLGFLVALFFIRDITKEKEERENLGNIYQFSVPFFLTTLIILSMLSIDVLLARRFFISDPDLVGKYAVLSTLGKIIFLGTASVGKTMFPLTSEKFEEKKETFHIFKKAFVLISVLCLIALAFFYLFPELIIKITFGSQYTDIAPLLFYEGIALTFLSLSSLILLYGLSINRIKNPYWLFLFLIIEIALLSIFNSNLKNYIIALAFSNIVMFIGSIFLIRR